MTMNNRITKTLRGKAGFTLVELIVVIAILGILAGVGTVGYSGYIKKANMAADQQLISDIEYALQLAGYSNTFAEGESGYITLSTDGIVNKDQIADDSGLDKAMKAAFGASYKDSMKLSYNGWGSNGLYNNLNPESAVAVKESSYMTGNRVDDLLADVETMTNMANNLVTVLAQNSGLTEGMTLSQMFSKDADETWEQWAANNEGANQTAYSNLLVLAAADESERYMSEMLSTGDAYEMSGASNMILEFSSFYAYAATNSEFSATLDDYLAHLNGEETDLGLAPVTNASTGKDWYNSLKAAAGTGYDDYLASTNATVGASQTLVDQNGFLSIMAGLGNPSEEQAKQVGADINNANLFTTGVVNGMYNDFLDGVDAMSGMYALTDENGDIIDYSEWSLGLGEGIVVVMVVQRNGQTVAVNSLPAAQ